MISDTYHSHDGEEGGDRGMHAAVLHMGQKRQYRGFRYLLKPCQAPFQVLFIINHKIASI